MSDPTPAQTAAFHAHMVNSFHATLHDKRTSPVMDALATVQAAFSRITPEAYRTRFATTIGNDIYAPYTPGVATELWSNWGQCCVVTHECRHVQQPGDHGGLLALGAEGLHTTGEAFIELEARTTTLELWWWRFGVLYPIDQLANDLVEYGCGPRDVEYVARGLTQASETITRGGIVTDPGRVAVAWLEANALEIAER